MEAAIKVNGEVIPAEAIRYELRRLVAFYSEHAPGNLTAQDMRILQRKAIEQAIGAKLLLDEAKRLNMAVAETEVDEKVNHLIKRCGGREGFDKMMEKQGLTEVALRESIRRGKQVDKLAAQIAADVPEATESEIKAYFDEHPDVVTKPARAQARHILIKPGSDGEADKQTARARLLELKRQVEEGADFGDLAAAHSECESGKKTGGSLGWITRKTMVPEFDDALFSLKVGEVSDVVETALGCHIIEKTDEEAQQPVPFEEARAEIGDLLKHMQRGKAISEYVERLRATAVIEEVKV